MVECFSLILWLLSSLPLLLIVLNIFQLEEYNLKKLFVWLYKNLKSVIKIYLTLFVCRIFILPYFLCSNFFIRYLCLIIFSISTFLFSYIVYFKIFALSKTPLKFTKRINRFLTIYSVFSLVGLYLLIYFVVPNLIRYLFCFYILGFLSLFVSSTFISYSVESFIFSYYKNQAIKKIKEMENLIVVGITGSYGKTTVKNILTSVLDEAFFVYKTPKSFNTPNGIVKSIREGLQKEHQIFICEMGANKNHDIRKLTRFFKDKLKIGIITSVGKQHLDGFKTIENIYNTKFELAEAVKANNGVMIFNISNSYVQKMYHEYDRNKIGVKLDGYLDGEEKRFIDKALNNKGIISGRILKSTKDGSEFEMSLNGEKLGTFVTRLLGEHNVLNSLLASGVAIALGEDSVDIKMGLTKVKQIPNRLEVKSLKSGAILIDNGFNSNPVSAEKALNALKYFQNNVKIVATPGLIELASEQFTENYLLGKKIAQVADKVVILNEVNKKAITNGLIDAGFNKLNISYYKNFNDEFVEFLNSLDNNHVVLIENDLPSNYI